MEFTYIGEGIDAMVIDNFYDDQQLNFIQSNLKALTNERDMFSDIDKLEAAVDNEGNYITTKYGLWMDEQDSILTKFSRDNFSKPEVYNKIIEHNSLYRVMYHMNKRSLLISYYENAGYYSKHIDASAFTILNYFHVEPKSFKGGEIVLHSHDMARKAIIEVKNNRVVIIPGCTIHEVLPIEMTSHKLDGSGRYCCSIFCFMEYRNLKKKDNDFN